MSVVGTSTPHSVACVRYDTKPPAISVPVSAASKARADHVALTTAASLVNPEKGILEVASGASLDSPGEAAVIVYVNSAKAEAGVPPTLDGVRTQVIRTDASALARDLAPKAPTSADGLSLTADSLAKAKTAVAQYAPGLLRDPAIFGVGVAQSIDNPADAALLVLVDPNLTPRAMPVTLGGLRVRYMKLNRFHVTRSKYAGPNPAPSCALKKLVSASKRGGQQPRISEVPLLRKP
jgi:hypothetical protein